MEKLKGTKIAIWSIFSYVSNGRKFDVCFVKLSLREVRRSLCVSTFFLHFVPPWILSRAFEKVQKKEKLLGSWSGKNSSVELKSTQILLQVLSLPPPLFASDCRHVTKSFCAWTSISPTCRHDHLLFFPILRIRVRNRMLAHINEHLCGVCVWVECSCL